MPEEGELSQSGVIDLLDKIASASSKNSGAIVVGKKGKKRTDSSSSNGGYVTISTLCD